MKSRIMSALVLLLAVTVMAAPGLPGKQTAQGNYLLYLPKDYGQQVGRRWPVVIFLHGSGERGANLDLVKKHGPPKLVEAGQQFPFILISPQCPSNQWWSIATLNTMLAEVSKQYVVDQSRVYLTGLSMGGYGTWTWAAENPDRFAALAPICGGGKPEWAARLKKVPIWVFHGGQDKTVPVARAEEMVDALKAVGSNVRLTVYPEAGHDSWTKTYNDPKFFDWLLQQRNPRRH